MKRRQFLALFLSVVLLLGMMPAARAELNDPASCPHEWQFMYHLKDATCTEGGTDVYTCFLCMSDKEVAVDPLGHDFRDDWSNSPVAAGPTCTSGGVQIRYCHRCQATKTGAVRSEERRGGEERRSRWPPDP